MKRNKLILGLLIFLVVALVTAFAALNLTEQGNSYIAVNFVKNEATYKFDGMPETFKLTGTTTLKCPLCREFGFEFNSRNAGYGDRKGAVVATVITPHSVKVEMEQGTIKSAVMDGVWDMKAQKMIADIRDPGSGTDEAVR